MIIETIVSTVNKKGEVNFAPFGIKKKKNKVFISPYIPSKTLLNLESTKCAVVNYTDNSKFFVNCIVGNKRFKKKKCNDFNGFFLNECFSYEEIIVKNILKHKIRPTFVCEIKKTTFNKNYEGFNRANSALIEACILASRIHLLSEKKIFKELDYLFISIKKTAGLSEKKSWERIYKFIKNKINEK